MFFFGQENGKKDDETNNRRSTLKCPFSIDQCDRMRISLGYHVAKMLNMEDEQLDGFDEYKDAGLLDLICRFIRYTWTLPLTKVVSNGSKVKKKSKPENAFSIPEEF